MDQSKFNGEDTWLGDEDLLDFDSEEECDEGVAHVSSQEMLCGVEMEVEPSSAPEQSEEPSNRAGGDLSGETQTNVTEPGEPRRHEDDGKPKGMFLIVLKSLLRHASVLSRSHAESHNRFCPVVQDIDTMTPFLLGRCQAAQLICHSASLLQVHLLRITTVWYI
jgi:hypothetical protein